MIEIDEIEACTTFTSSLSPEDFDSCYEFVLARLRELKEILEQSESISDTDELIESLQDIYGNILDLYDDSILYDDMPDDEDEEDDWGFANELDDDGWDNEDDFDDDDIL